MRKINGLVDALLFVSALAMASSAYAVDEAEQDVAAVQLPADGANEGGVATVVPEKPAHETASSAEDAVASVVPEVVVVDPPAEPVDGSVTPKVPEESPIDPLYPAERLAGSRTEVFSCSYGRFKGEVEATISFASVPRGLYLDVQVARYKITRSPGQQGGDSANLDFHLSTRSKEGVLWIGKKNTSPDAMKQTGLWQTYEAHQIVRASHQGTVSFEFIFDVPRADDPHCVVNKTYQWTGV